jgi:hypothetical protein
MFTDREKWQAAERELNMRRRVYPNWVASGRMTQQLAERQIALMEDIAADYRARIMESE